MFLFLLVRSEDLNVPSSSSQHMHVPYALSNASENITRIGSSMVLFDGGISNILYEKAIQSPCHPNHNLTAIIHTLKSFLLL